MIQIVPETGSTNADLVARLDAGENLPAGSWLIADRQTAGRGRQGRAWFDGYGNFMGSTVVDLSPASHEAQWLALVAGLALYEAVLPLLPDPAALKLKWPNDLMLGDAKLSGILMERAGNKVVLGVGVNLAKAPDVEGRPTIAVADVAPAPRRDHFAETLAGHLDRELERWRSYGTGPIIRRWLAAAHPVGTPLTIHDGGNQLLSGAFDGLTDDGALRLRLADGATHVIHAGDVMLAD